MIVGFKPRTTTARTPWGRVREEAKRLPAARRLRDTAPELHRAHIGGELYHPAWCPCSDCRDRRDPTAPHRMRRDAIFLLWGALVGLLVAAISIWANS